MMYRRLRLSMRFGTHVLPIQDRLMGFIDKASEKKRLNQILSQGKVLYSKDTESSGYVRSKTLYYSSGVRKYSICPSGLPKRL